MLNREYQKELAKNGSRVTNAFPLLRYFTIISLISIVITSIFLAISARNILVDSLIESEERSNVSLTLLIGNSIWPNFKYFIRNAKVLSKDEILNSKEVQALNRFVKEQIKGLSIIKIKIFDLDGLTVFSSELNEIGKSKKTHPSFIEAKTGKVVSKLSFRDKIYAKQELIENRNIITSYVPIYGDDKNKVLSVFEVYKDVTDTVEKLNALQFKIVAIVIGVSVLLFLILFFTIRRTDEIIKQFNVAQEKITNEIRDVAFHDHLTGLPNRVLFLDRLEHAVDISLRSEKLIALMFIDLDRFKQVNDNLGHESGDQLLTQIADRFIDSVRPSDTVARISGDEFTIILENLSNIELATIVAQRIQSKMQQPFLIGKHKVFVTCSIGISIYPFDDDDADSLIKKADAAMFYSKSYGRNTFHYYSPDMLEHGSIRYELETELNSALENEQFFLYFQPKVDLVDGSLQGVNISIGWRHPDKGLVKPEIFMPMLEETGLIVEVGAWVLNEGCHLLKKWQEEGLPLIRVAFSINATQFNSSGFFDTVIAATSEASLETKHIELEFSEGCLIEEENNDFQSMRKLKDKGIHLTMGDFGTGFSSLSYLSKLPIETLKIDKIFIRDMMTNARNRTIITAIMSFAHNLKLNIFVDGIETKQQLMFVSAMRCNYIQGELISGKLEEAEFYKLYKSGDDFNKLFDS